MTKEERQALVLAKFKEWGITVSLLDPAAAPASLKGDIPIVVRNGNPKLLLISFSQSPH